MSEKIFKQMLDCGQSIWLDNISRSLISTGKLKELINAGLRGLTSNPTIFDKAVSKSTDYDGWIRDLKAEGRTTFEIYDAITVQDIQDACDAFTDVYNRTDGLDGYVSLEIDPRLAHDTAATVKEGKRLHTKVGRPNLMLKVPGTDAGFPAITALISERINVNVTLIFSLDKYERAADAYLAGLEALTASAADVGRVRSVASVFVSRIDTLVDRMIQELGGDAGKAASSLRGRAAVANSAVIYERFRAVFSGKRFLDLEKTGAKIQRIVWGSTSTKDPAYSDTKYVAELIGPDTVNTIPTETLEAFIDHGLARQALPGDTVQARQLIHDLARAGIDLDDVCGTLLEDGVKAFQRSFESLLHSIEQKAAAL